ncbi:phosphoserine phosphatase RsbU/P [Candidatus Magnetomoraceae bacterium gMMP-1]
MKNKKKITVLVVDDTPVIMIILKKMLKMEGYNVLTANNGADARKIACEDQPDLILLDIMMPDEDGFETCTLLKNNPQTVDIAIIFISAITDVNNKVKGLEMGAVDYITKPFEKQEVLARVRLHLKLKFAYETVVKAQAEKLKQIYQAQQAILVRPEDLPDANFAVSYKPMMEAGGDFYDVCIISDHIYGYFVADVSGHNLKSSYLTSALKALFAQNAQIIYKPKETMTMINKVLTSISKKNSNDYLTACYALINLNLLQLTIVSAGHPPVIYMNPHGDCMTLQGEGDVIGVFDNVFFQPIIKKLSKGVRFFLYTDGFIEGSGKRKKSRKEGIKELCAACTKTRDMQLDKAIKKITDMIFPDLKEQEDDLLLLGVEVPD